MTIILRCSLLAFVLVGVVAMGWFRSDPAAAVTKPPGDATSDPDRVDSESFDRWLPALREGAAVTFSDGSGEAEGVPGPARPIARLETLGPLEGRDFDVCVETMERISRRRFEDLHELPPVTEPGVPYELLHQAELLCAAEEYLAAARGLRDGDYFVTPPGKLPPPPPGAGIVQTTARQNGRRVIVSIILPFDKHRRFADAYHYKRDIWLNYPAHAVDHWNRQEDSWRRAAAERVARTARRQVARDDALWRRRFAPGGTFVDPDTKMLALH